MEIEIKKKQYKGEDGHKTLSIRIPEKLVVQLDGISNEANISRNELINILLTEGTKLVKIKE